MTKDEILAKCGRHDPQVLADPDEKPDCRRWLGPRTNCRAPILRINGKPFLASRLMMQAVIGRPLRADEAVRHLCGLPYCLNPDHLKIIPASQRRQRRNIPKPTDSRPPAPSLRVRAALADAPRLTGEALFRRAARAERCAAHAP